MSAARVVRTGGMLFDGRTGYAVVPITFYGWREFTILEWIYLVRPKANFEVSKTSIIGDPWVQRVATQVVTAREHDYAFAFVQMMTRLPDGTGRTYGYNLVAFANTWIHLGRSFSLNDRVFSVYVNGARVYSVRIPDTETTVLEQDPATAAMPDRFMRYVLGANVIYAEHMTVIYGSVRIYSKRLRDSDVALLYQRDELITDGLELWLPFYEGTGSVIRDVSGKNRHATAYGSFMWVVKPSVRQLAPARVLPKAR